MRTPDPEPLPPTPLPRRRWWDALVPRHDAHPRPAAPDAPAEVARGWTPADVLALVSWLPDDSATAASFAGGRHHFGWGQDRWIAKSTFDAVQTNTVVAMKIAAGKKHGRVKAPDTWPTPDEQQKVAERNRPKVSVANLPRLTLGPRI